MCQSLIETGKRDVSIGTMLRFPLFNGLVYYNSTLIVVDQGHFYDETLTLFDAYFVSESKSQTRTHNYGIR